MIKKNNVNFFLDQFFKKIVIGIDYNIINYINTVLYRLLLYLS